MTSPWGYTRRLSSRNLISSLFIVTLIVSILLSPSLFALRTVEAGERPNSHAIFNITYSTTRYRYTPELKTGEIEIELYEKRAPITTANFIKLAESGFYDGTMYHRVIDDFVIQGGDPNTKDNENQLDWLDDGEGGSGETIPLEIHPELTHVDGAVGMAREFGNPDSAESQFYICDGPQHRLDDNEENNANRTYAAIDENGYAVFAITVRGIEVVRDIATVWTTTDLEQETEDPLPTIAAHINDHPMFDVLVNNVTVVHYKAKEDDKGITAGQAALLGAGIFVMAGIIMIVLINQGRMKEVEARLPDPIRKRIKP